MIQGEPEAGDRVVKEGRKDGAAAAATGGGLLPAGNPLSSDHAQNVGGAKAHSGVMEHVTASARDSTGAAGVWVSGSPPAEGGFIREAAQAARCSSTSKPGETEDQTKLAVSSSSSSAITASSGSASTSSTRASNEDGTVSGGSNPGSPPSTPEARRVKVYQLRGDTWIDRGTGHCIGIFEAAPPNVAALGFCGPVLGGQFISTGPPSPGSSRTEGQERGRKASGRLVSTGTGEARIEVRKEGAGGEVGGELLLRTRVIRPNPGPKMSPPAEDVGSQEEKGKGKGRAGEGSSSSPGSSPEKGGEPSSSPGWPEGGGIYQRQQDTLVVWTELDGTDMALSFATPAGCQELWRFICEAQEHLGPGPPERVLGLGFGLGPRRSGGRNDAGGWDDDDPAMYGSRRTGDDDERFSIDILSTSSPSSSPPLNMTGIQSLPEPTLSNIPEIDFSIKLAARTAMGRERVTGALLKTNFVKKMEAVFIEAEDLESITDLHALCLLMQSILLLNDAAVYEYCVHDEIYMTVAKVLEYDPEFGNSKAAYKEHLSDPSRFREVVPIRDPGIRFKIHQTFRLTYFKDVILARILDDPTFSILSSMIFFNQVDIVTHLQQNETFLKELFGIFDDGRPAAPMIGPVAPSPKGKPASGNTSDLHSEERKDEAILLLQQLCSMAKNLQAPQRAGFYRSLCEHGLLGVIEQALARKEQDPTIRAATCEVLVTVIDHDANSVRNYCLKHQETKGPSLVPFLIDLMLGERDLGLKVQLVEALRILVDPGGDGPRMEAGVLIKKEEDPETEKFLTYFYDNCVMLLFKPITDLPDSRGATDRPLTLSRAQIACFNHLCDLLCFFVSHHAFRSKYFVFTSNLSPKVAILLHSRYKHLRLAALRYFRACIGRNDDFYNRYLMRHDLFSPVVELTIAESAHDNLLSSACLEYFEHLRTCNVKPVLNHLMEHKGDQIRFLAERLPTIRLLILKWEQNNEPPPKSPPDAGNTDPTRSTGVRNIGSWSRTKTLDADEESYFNDSDEETDVPIATSARSNGARGRPRSDGTEPRDGKRPRISPGAEASKDVDSPLFGLMEYGDDSDEEKPQGPRLMQEALAGSTPPPLSPSMGTTELPAEGQGQGPGPGPSPSPSSSPARPAAATGLSRTSSSTSLGSLSGAAPPAFKLGERRRREEEAEDQLGLLGERMKRGRTEKAAGATTAPPGSSPLANGRSMSRGTAAKGGRPGGGGGGGAPPKIGAVKINLGGALAGKLTASANGTLLDPKDPKPGAPLDPSSAPLPMTDGDDDDDEAKR